VYKQGEPQNGISTFAFLPLKPMEVAEWVQKKAKEKIKQ